jgi:hypothetical protein
MEVEVVEEVLTCHVDSWNEDLVFEVSVMIVLEEGFVRTRRRRTAKDRMLGRDCRV